MEKKNKISSETRFQEEPENYIEARVSVLKLMKQCNDLKKKLSELGTMAIISYQQPLIDGVNTAISNSTTTLETLGLVYSEMIVCDVEDDKL